jgi:hypothetical protein
MQRAGRVEIRYPTRSWDCFSLQNVQTESGAQPRPIEKVLKSLSLEVKRPKREPDHSSPSTAEARRSEAVLLRAPPPPRIISLAWTGITSKCYTLSANTDGIATYRK